MKDIFTFCKPYLKPYRGRIATLVLLFIAAGLMSVILPYLTGSFLDALINGEAGERMKFYLGLIAALAAGEFFLGYASERIYIGVQCRVGHALNADTIYHIQNMPYSFMRDRNTTFLNQQINNDANAVVIYCISVLQNILSSGLTLIIPLTLIICMEPWLGVAMVAVNLTYYVLFAVFRNPVLRAQREFMNEQADYFAKLGTQLTNVRFVQTHGLAKSYIARLGRSLERLLSSSYRTQKAQYAFGGSDIIMQCAANLLAFFLGGRAVLRGRMTAGEFTVVLSYFSMTLGATRYFFSLGRDTQRTRVSRDRLAEIIDKAEQTNGTEKPADIGRIECSGVSFRYGEENVLTDRNEIFEKGKIYAFVGENGAGKSTFISLLLGLFIDQYEGSVYYDGVPIEKLDMRAVRREMVGVSEQEPMLLEDTLRFNLTFDDQAEVDEQEFLALCEMLNLNAFVRQLPNGLDTVVREGSTNLSGGEKQKISIIRALMKHPKLLVLDEPTSALDRVSAEKLIGYLDEIRGDMIILISTHDEALLRICSETVRITKQNGILGEPGQPR